MESTNRGTADRIVVLSLHPEWWEKIMAGEKHLEIRKTKPQGRSFAVMVYITGGKGIVGEFYVDTFYYINVKPDIDTWALPKDESKPPYNLQKASCLAKEQLKAYAGDNEVIYGWHIENPREYESKLTLGDIGLKSAPQSWCYARI